MVGWHMSRGYDRTKGYRSRVVRRSHKRTCRLKIGYPSRDAAFTALRRLGKKGRDALKVYRCACCRKYHLGNGPGTRLWSQMDAIKSNS